MLNTHPELDDSAKSRLRRVMSTVLVAYLLLMSYFLCFYYFSNLRQAETASLMRLNGIARTLAMQIDGDAHQQLMARFDAKDAIQSASQDSLHQSIHQVLIRNATANMLATPLYTIVLDSTNACFFGVTSAKEPYFRHLYHSASARKTAQELGLTLVKKVIELHGERVWAESNDSLTNFRFTLPVFEPTEKSPNL